MTNHNTLRAMALAGVCLAPLAAAAQDFDLGGAGSSSAAGPAKEYNNEIDVGARYQSSTSPLYGRYNGDAAKGFGSLGGFHLQSTITPENGAPLSVDATGKNLNFQPNNVGPNNELGPESEIDVNARQQGIWAAHAYYDAITYTGQTFYSPYTSTGSLVPGLTPFGGRQIVGYNGATTASAGAAPSASTLLNSLRQETAGTRRDIGGVDGKYIIGEWTITSGLRHEHKEGTLLETMWASYQGTTFPKPVDYDTDRYNVQAQYATRRLQATLGYDFSKFTDNNSTFDAPYFVPSSTANQFTTAYSLPPNNDAHYITGMVGYNITPTTRANGNFRYGIEESNAAITPITASPSGQLSASTNALLAGNQSTTNEFVRTYDGNLSVTSRPISNLDVKIGYGVDGRQPENNPVKIYGSGTFEAEGNSVTAASYIQQQSWTKQNATVEAGYRILPNTKLTLGYRFDDTDRSAGTAPITTGVWVGHSTQNTLSAKVAVTPVSNVNSSLTYEHTVRAGQFELESVATSTAPTSGAFYQAPMTGDAVKLRTDYTPSEEWDFGVNGRYQTHHYNYPVSMTGTQRDYNANIGPDVSYSPTKSITTHLFYTYEEIYYVNRGNGVPSTLNGYGYSATTTDSLHTAGLSADWKVTDRLKLGTDYTFSYGDIAYNLFDGGLVSTSSTAASYYNIQNLPTVSSSMHSLKLHGEYQLAPNISLLAGYGFDLYKDNDWSTGWSPVVLASGVTSYTTSGESQSSYRVHSLYTAVRFKF